LLALSTAHPGLPPTRRRPSAADTAAPRIGLALSGGGARGIAHVGVLKVLEEMRIPIHCVTGTSMGAIVGGTFSAGVTPEKLQEVVLKTNWDEIFRDQPPRQEIAIRRKVDDYKTLFRPEFGVKDGGLALPTGVLAGVSIEAFFRVLTAQAYDISNFEKLPIPFRAMATDIETGESVVLDHGSIAQAMRASMSVPGALAPVEIDGKLLVDGGIANNLPIDEARKLCDADVIIAVNISTPPLKRSEITSALSVAGQLVNFLGKQTVDEQLKSLTARDVLIAPISATSRPRNSTAPRTPYGSARRRRASLLRRCSVTAWRPNSTRRCARRRSPGRRRPRRWARSSSRGSNAPIRKCCALWWRPRPGEPLNEAKIGDDLRRIYGPRRLRGDRLHDRRHQRPARAHHRAREKSWGPDYLRFGLGLASDFKGDNAFNVLFEYRKTWLNRLGGEWLTQFQIGQNTYLGTEFYQPVEESGRWFVQPYALAGQQTRGVFVGNDKVADYRIGNLQGGIDGGAVLDTWGQFKMGPVWTHVDARVDTGAPVLPAVKELTSGIRAQLFVDRLDQAWFPTDGVSANVQAYAALTSLGSAQSYQKLEGAARWVKSWGNNTVQIGCRAVPIWGRTCPPTNRSRSAGRCTSRATASTSSRAANSGSPARCTTTRSFRCRTSSARAYTSGRRPRPGG
jgi:NTE family protein